MTPAEILKSLKENQKLADVDLENVPPTVRLGMDGAKRQAQDALEDLKKEYLQAIRANAIVVILQGDQEKQTAFADLSSHLAETLTLNCQGMYDSMAAALYPLVGSKGEFPASLMSDVIDALRGVVKGCGIRSIPGFDLGGDSYFFSQKELAVALRTAIRKSSDDDINKLVLENRLGNQALEVSYAGNAVGVCLVGATKEEADNLVKTLCAGNNAIVEIPEGQVISDEYVVTTLKNVHKQIKAKKRQ